MALNLLVCISKVPDTTSKIAFKDSNSAFNEDGVTFIINPYDEWYALVRALELVEQQQGSVTVVSVGKADYEPILRKALALGAAKAVRIDTQALDAAQVASELAAYVRQQSFDLVLCGKETIDYNGAMVPAMLAAQLGWPLASHASSLQVADGKASAQLEAQGGTNEVEFSLPAVVSAAKGMAEQRIPNMRGIMEARTKPLEVVAPAGASPLSTHTSFELPPAKTQVKLFGTDQVEDLVRALHHEAKAI